MFILVPGLEHCLRAVPLVLAPSQLPGLHLASIALKGTAGIPKAGRKLKVSEPLRFNRSGPLLTAGQDLNKPEDMLDQGPGKQGGPVKEVGDQKSDPLCCLLWLCQLSFTVPWAKG